MGVRVASSLMQLSFGCKRPLERHTPIEEFQNRNSSSSPGEPPIRSVESYRGETMSVTRTAVFIGIMCAAWMASPLTANAVEFKKFVGTSDKASINVKKCIGGERVGKSGKRRYSSGVALNVGLEIDLAYGDGLDRDDNFDAVLFFGQSGTPLFSGAWSRINERNGVVTYQLTPSGDLAALPPSDGWKDLLDLMNELAGDACEMVPPAKVYWALSELMKGTLVVNTNPEGTIACPADEGSCSRAWVHLDVKSFMDDGSDGWGSPKTDSVKFKYEGKGYVVSTGLAATPTPTATPTATPTPTPTAVP
jgi:hypothetical protein